MKHLRYLLMAALVAMPLTACDEDDDTVTPTETTIVGTVSGTVSAEGTGLSGVSVTLVGAATQSASTGSGGTFTFSNVEAGSYGVSIDASNHPDVSFSQTSKSTSITTDGQTAVVDFAGSYIRTASIQGLVVAGEKGVVGVTATLTGGPDSVNKTAQSNTGGEFTFTGLRAGDYTVVISNLPSDVSFATTSNSVTISTVGETVTTAFSGDQLEPATISGVVLADGNPLGQVTVTLTMGSTTVDTKLTNASGEYMFGKLDPGTYTVAISGYDQNRYDFSTTSYTATVDYGDEAVHNFGGAGNTASVAIERITLPNGNAANRNAVAGMVVVQVGVDQGSEDVTNVTTTLNGIQFGEQDFTRNVAGPELGDDEEFEVDFPVNTAQTLSAPPFTPTWFNGVNTIVATVTTADGDVVTSSEDITLVNVDLLALDISAANPGNGDVDTLIDPVTGLRWLSGSLTFNLYPIIYSSPFDPNDPPIARANIMFDAFCSSETLVQGDTRPTVGAAATQMTYTMPWTTAAGPQADGSFTWTMSDAVNCRTSTMGADDLITGWMGAQDFTINTVTQHGQPGPGAFCPNISTTCVGTGGTVAANPLLFYFNDELQSGTGAINNFLRVDNQEPYAGTIDLDPHPLWTNFAATITANYAAWIDANGIDLLRGGNNANGLRDGWLNHAYAFDTGMWGRTAGTGFYTTATATDAPNTYPANTLFSAGYPTAANTPVGANVVVPGAALMGIGMHATTPLQGYYAMYTNGATTSAASTLTGIGTARQRLVSATTTADCSGTTGPCQVATGADLYPEPCLGCAPLTPPNDNQWNDNSVAAIAVDQFFNAGYTNVMEVGVDGQAPIFGTITWPTTAGTVYNTYGTVDSYGDLKTAGVFTANTTDSGQGFSGVAGVDMLDVENGCAAGQMACATAINTRTGVQLQALPGAPATATLLWTWDAIGGTTFFSGLAGIGAYDATLATYLANDGYRQQLITTWDRAANSAVPTQADDAAPTVSGMTTEHIADKAIPVFGNVTMPGDPLFVNGTGYTFMGQVNDGNINPVDLDFVDFGFDFNGITTVQTYIDPVVGTPQRPNPDINTWQFRARSLQLPLRNVDMTDFGSQSIILQDNSLSQNVAFLGCVVRFDEVGLATLTTHPALAGLEPVVHRPRGPRWRVWDHAMGDVLIDGAAGPNIYPLVNTQFNTFVLTSLPACTLTPAQMAALVTPAFNSAGSWAFGIGADTGGTSLELAVYGPSGTFVPSFTDLTAVDLYYIDVSGRARLLDASGTNWSGPVVSDTGAGPLARAYVWTYTGAAPTDIDATQQSGGYFFVWRFSGANAGMGMIWDVNSN